MQKYLLSLAAPEPNTGPDQDNNWKLTVKIHHQQNSGEILLTKNMFFSEEMLISTHYPGSLLQ